jgi:hypothetical protein
MTKSLKHLALSLAFAALALGGCSAGQRLRPLGSPSMAVSVALVSPVAAGTVDGNTTTVTGTVQEIDSEHRKITLRQADGTEFAMVIEPDVDDVEGFHKGDDVSLTYREWVAFHVKKPDQAKPGVAHTTDVTRPPRGEKPGGVVTDTVNIRAPIAAIDKAASAVTVRDLTGGTTVVRLPDPGALEAVVVGDVLDIAYTSVVAITVREKR